MIATPFHARAAAAVADPRVRAAFQLLQDREAEIESDQIRLTLVPAPPFHEEERGRHFAQMVRSLGFSPVVDGIGNVVFPYDNTEGNPVIVGAHLDTVFPRDVKLELRRSGRVVRLPGISDNGAGLVALLWLFRVASEAGLCFDRPVWGVANVGEEGQGNLRGVRHLFESRPWGISPCEFVALDGAGVNRITNQGLGSRRFRVRMIGPGGHSWADFGRPNPVHAMANAIHHFVRPRCGPGTSFNVGVIQGGIGVNSIPREATIDVDVRSTSFEHLDSLQSRLRRTMTDAAAADGLAVEIEAIGERPLGYTPEQSDIVQSAIEVTRTLGVGVQLNTGSTDANIPMSLGIPAIAIGAGGAGGGIHTTDEWFNPEERALGLQRLLALVAVRAGLR
ncbi:MAG TPA: M20/M25/M40 family metallo-hydrolase [Terriglobia bacterium]|nr:M20/M25/M40 family metallo-hydrolase [Terriglobia bacterium]